MRGLVFDVQTYALYDGPGIRTCVFLKGCPLRCWWCHNPESQRREPEMSWSRARCSDTRACVAACPYGGLTRSADGLVRDADLCRACGACAAACPEGALERIGEDVDADELIARVARDRAFFEASGGGITFSGGEPTSQIGFLLRALELAGEAGLHRAIETCGAFDPRWIDPLVERVELFLFDLKHVDRHAHRRGTGSSNTTIMANFDALLAKAGAERVTPRIPLIPGFNTDAASRAVLADFLCDRAYPGPVHLMPYHGWARDKYERIGRADDYRPATAISDDLRRDIQDDFRRAGLEPVWGG